MDIKQAVVFAILMENNQGIIGKAPAYIWEKLQACSTMNEPEMLLDENNQAKFKKWKSIWLKEVSKNG